MVTKFDNAEIEIEIKTDKAIATLKDLDKRNTVVKEEVREAKNSARLFGQKDTKGTVKTLFQSGRGRLSSGIAAVGKYVAIASLVDQLVVPIQNAIINNVRRSVKQSGIQAVEDELWFWTGGAVDLDILGAFESVVKGVIAPLQEQLNKLTSLTAEASAGIDATNEVLEFTRNAAILGRMPAPSNIIKLWTDTQRIRHAEREFNKFIERGRTQSIMDTFIQHGIKWIQSL